MHTIVSSNLSFITETCQIIYLFMLLLSWQHRLAA